MHAPLARQMGRELCADDPKRWLECQQVTTQCVEARMALWDGKKVGKTRPAFA